MTAVTKTQRDLYETAVIERLKESGFLEIEIRTESLSRCGEGYQDEVINAGWHYWNAALSAAEQVKPYGYVYESTVRYFDGRGTQRKVDFSYTKKNISDEDIEEFEISETAVYPAFSAQEQGVARTVEAFDKDHPELYWHIAKGKITAGEPLYGAIITDMAGNELGHGESDVNAVDAFKIAGAKASFPSAPEKQDIAALETRLKHLITTRPNKAALAARDNDTRMWFVAQLTGNASGRVPLTEIEALVARHLPVISDPYPN